MSENKIKKAVIREDLLAITGDFRKAIILNQFIYWSERVSDADKFIEKENEIAKSNGKEGRELFYGWIYKTAEELSEEVMLGLSTSQIRRYINDLVDLGYISKRTNPNYKWDRTLQYRVNLVNIAKALKEKGYPLSDYKIEILDNGLSNTHPCKINEELKKNQSQSGERAIPENTTENTNRDYKQKTLSGESTVSECANRKPDKTKSANRKKDANELFERLWSLYPLKKGKASVSDTQKLKLLDIGYDELERAIGRYRQYVESIDYLHYKNGSTFFNSGYIDYLDENYTDSDTSDTNPEKNKNAQDKCANTKNIRDNPKEYKSAIQKAIQEAEEKFGEEFGEQYWKGMDDGEIEAYMGILGINVI